MRLAVFGLGYVGFTSACCLAGQGHHVTGVDIDEGKIADIEGGRLPFVEPGLAELLAPARRAGRLRATTDARLALAEAAAAFVCVGTPSGPDGSHDMGAIIHVTRQIADALAAATAGRQVATRGNGRSEDRASGSGTKQPVSIVYRSTMRPGSMEQLVTPIFEERLGPGWRGIIRLAYHPEFLREGQAVNDFYHPPRILVGTETGEPDPTLAALLVGHHAPAFVTDFATAELCKFVDNSWHAVKVAFANEMGRVCDRLGISADRMHEIFVADRKLNISARYLRPGAAFGGSCLPKDVRALQYLSTELGLNNPLIDSLLRSNDAQKSCEFEAVTARVQPGGKILMMGLTFKPGTDDLRESPHVDLARRLLNAGYKLRIHDPNVTPSKLRGHNLGFLYATMPQIERLLISKEDAEAEDWDLVLHMHDRRVGPAPRAARTLSIAALAE